jgi:predicted transglutaminase-like protease
VLGRSDNFSSYKIYYFNSFLIILTSTEQREDVTMTSDFSFGYTQTISPSISYKKFSILLILLALLFPLFY